MPLSLAVTLLSVMAPLEIASRPSPSGVAVEGAGTDADRTRGTTAIVFKKTPEP